MRRQSSPCTTLTIVIYRHPRPCISRVTPTRGRTLRYNARARPSSQLAYQRTKQPRFPCSAQEVRNSAALDLHYWLGLLSRLASLVLSLLSGILDQLTWTCAVLFEFLSLFHSPSFHPFQLLSRLGTSCPFSLLWSNIGHCSLSSPWYSSDCCLVQSFARCAGISIQKPLTQNFPHCQS